MTSEEPALPSTSLRDSERSRTVSEANGAQHKGRGSLYITLLWGWFSGFGHEGGKAAQFFVPAQEKRIRSDGLKFAEGRSYGGSQQLRGFARAEVGAALGFWHNLVYQPQLKQFLRRQLQDARGLLLVVPFAPPHRTAPLRGVARTERSAGHV